jgi:hypothetical protein
VYLIAHASGLWACYVCKLKDELRIVTLNTLGEVQDHLQAHRDAGHKVPDRAFATVQKEIALYGSDYVNPPYEEGQSYEEGGQCLKAIESSQCYCIADEDQRVVGVEVGDAR